MMGIDPQQLDSMEPQAKREFLARMLKERAAGVDNEFELSLGQEGLWFLNELTPWAVPYNVAMCVRVRATVDHRRLESAIRTVIERHPMLRCTLSLREQGPRQRVGPVPEHPLEIVDASDWSESELKAQVQGSYAQPFDLTRGPVFRATLFSRQVEDYVLLLSAHHIVLDAWSMGVIAAELSVLYESGSAVALARPAAYADFVRWQRGRVDSDAGREAWEYWRSRLQGFATPLDLPTDHPRPSVRSASGATHHFGIDAPLCARVRQVARETNATPFMVLAAALQAMLHRYTGSPEVAIGTAIAGRGQPSFEHTVGYFVNPVVLCARIQPDNTFRQQIAEMREAVIGAQVHGEFPFPELVKRLQPERDNSSTPLFQVMLNFVKMTQSGMNVDGARRENETLLRLGSLPAEDYPVDQTEGQFDLTMEFFENGDVMHAVLRYSTDLFEAGTIKRMAEHFETFLTAAVADPASTISRLPLMSEQERLQVQTWNETATSYPRQRTIHELFELQAAKTPNSCAVVVAPSDSCPREDRITYQGLSAASNQLARQLRVLGVEPGDRVGLALPRDINVVVAILAILKAGATYVPIDTSYPKERIAYMLRDASIKLLLTIGNETIGCDDVGVLSLRDANGSISAQSPMALENRSDSQAVAYLMYTSGTTGRPKAVCVTHRNVVRLVQNTNYASLSSDEVFLACAPFSFDASTFELWGSLLNGGQLVLYPEAVPTPESLARTIGQYGITTLWLTAGLFHLMVETQPDCLASLRQLLAGGDVLSPTHVRKALQVLRDGVLINGYGPTENTTFTCCHRMDASTVIPEAVPIGRPIANTCAYILDRNMQLVPIGVRGELWAGGDGVAMGYHNSPELTASHFVADPFSAEPGARMYRTGDWARWLADGTIEFLGRKDTQVKVRGFRIELGEIEAALSGHASVSQAVVVARKETNSDARLAAYVVARPRTAIDAAGMRAYLHNRLPEYMVPSAYVLLDAFPLNHSGKVDRNALPAPERKIEAAAYEAALTPTEQVLAGIFAELLKLERVGMRDNFFDLGGHSLIAMRLLARVRAKLGVDLSIQQLFEARTVFDLAEVVQAQLAQTAGAKPDAAPAIPRIERTARRARADAAYTGLSERERQ